MRPLRRHALRAALVVALASLALVLVRGSDPAVTPPDDFATYWAAGRLNVAGENPYDAARALAVQKTAGWPHDIPYRCWYPPWALPLVTPFAVVPYGVGRFLWYLANIAALVGAARLLWWRYGGDPAAAPLATIVAFTFWPGVIALATGQVSAFFALGLAGLLAFEARGRCALAGACLVLAAVKPQVLHLVWVALVLWIVRTRRFAVFWGAAGTAGALTLLAAATNPPVVAQFVRMALEDAPAAPASTLGTVLRGIVRTATGREVFWLQFVPPVLSLLWLGAYWRRHRLRWDWAERMPALVLASIITTVYAWVYDQVVLLVPVVAVAAALSRREARSRWRLLLAGYALTNAALVVMNVTRVRAFWYIWAPFAFLAWYASARLGPVPPPRP